jgi:hypothetical protein
MIHPIRRTKATIAALKAFFLRFVVAIEQLEGTIGLHTITVKAHTEAQNEINYKLDALIKHNAYLAAEKKSEIRRAGLTEATTKGAI